MADLNIIRIKNAVFYAYHGAGEEEQNLGGKFEVDIDMYCDLLPAAETDSLKKTVDYEKVYAYVSSVVHSKKNYLIEALAHTIARGIIREFFNVEMVTIRIRKPHPPVKGVVDHVEVELTEKR
ncbi:MAG TPA: dihydroneopterin aldolase [Bacteroidetes bacterium]|jgi:7,8-dihydroneopterin aldolase/epimerase/oxygenase|nr:dihydroneopterin aldolase [Bacteroidota bacterium]